MSTAERFREYAAECVQKASGTQNPEEKNLHLNMALAWIRLAHQSEAIGTLVDQVEALGAAEETTASASEQSEH